MLTKAIYIYLIACMVGFSSLSQGFLLSHEKHIKASKNGIVEESTYLYQVASKGYQWLGDVTVPQFEGSNVKIIEAYIQDTNGLLIRKLKKSEISKRSYISSMALYEDDMAYEFRLFHNKYPYQIYYKTKTTYSEYINLARWSPIKYYGIPTLHAKLTVDLADGFGVNIYSPPSLESTLDSMSGYVRLTWIAKGVHGINKETYSPPINEITPQVLITPNEFRYGVNGSSKSWADFGKWNFDLNQKNNDLPTSERNKILQLINGIENPRDKIEKIYHYMQSNHRYIFVAIDAGGFKSYPASYVVKNRYGDCKALTTYMKAALEVAGINSYYTLINADSNVPRLIKEVPGNQFNHVILCVPIENDTIWLENTSNWTPMNYMGPLQGREALLVDDDNSQLVSIPSLSTTASKTISQFDINLANPDSPLITITSKLGGELYDDLNYCVKNESLETQRKYVLNQVLPFNNAPIITYETLLDEQTNLALGYKAQLSASSLCRSLGNMTAISLPEINFYLDERPEDRVFPVRINFPISFQDTISYQLPSIAGEIVVPEEFSLASNYGKYSLKIQSKDSTVTVIRNFIIYSGDYPVSEYQYLYSFISEIKNQEKKTLLLIKD